MHARIARFVDVGGRYKHKLYLSEPEEKVFCDWKRIFIDLFISSFFFLFLSFLPIIIFSISLFSISFAYQRVEKNVYEEEEEEAFEYRYVCQSIKIELTTSLRVDRIANRKFIRPFQIPVITINNVKREMTMTRRIGERMVPAWKNN